MGFEVGWVPQFRPPYWIEWVFWPRLPLTEFRAEGKNGQKSFLSDNALKLQSLHAVSVLGSSKGMNQGNILDYYLPRISVDTWLLKSVKQIKCRGRFPPKVCLKALQCCSVTVYALYVSYVSKRMPLTDEARQVAIRIGSHFWVEFVFGSLTLLGCTPVTSVFFFNSQRVFLFELRKERTHREASYG